MHHKILSAIGIFIIIGIIGVATRGNNAKRLYANIKQDELKTSYDIGENAKYKGVEMTVLHNKRSDFGSRHKKLGLYCRY